MTFFLQGASLSPALGFQAAVAMARSGKEAEQAGNRMMQEIEEEEGESPDFEDLGPSLHNMTRPCIT